MTSAKVLKLKAIWYSSLPEFEDVEEGDFGLRCTSAEGGSVQRVFGISQGGGSGYATVLWAFFLVRLLAASE